MRLFTKKQLTKHDNNIRISDRHDFMQGTAHNAAKYAVHSIVCMRTIETWRELLAEAEKQGDKYMSLADLMVKAGIKR